jgi:hypothetical protein
MRGGDSGVTTRKLFRILVDMGDTHQQNEPQRSPVRLRSGQATGHKGE